MRRRWVAAAAAGAVLALAACSDGGASPAPAESTVTSQAAVGADKAAAPTPDVPVTWPLTGVEGTPVERPALTVKIENTAAARPQTGLEDADLVWEEIVDFGVSRLAATFHSKEPAEVGPIRSVRPMDPAISSPTHGLLVFSGGQPGILALVAASGEQLFSQDAGAPGMYRSKDRKAPHNVYGTPSVFWSHADADHQASPGEQFLFARTPAQAAAVTAGSPASTLTFDLTALAKPRWTWDAASGTWQRSEGTQPAVAKSGARLGATNVVSIVAQHPNTPFAAQGGAPVPTYVLTGTGTGFVATGGKTVPVTWKKDADDQPMRLFLADGSPALLAPGNTWVELVPEGSSTVTIG